MSESRRLLSEAFAGAMRYRVKAHRASSRAATLNRMLVAELSCEPPVGGGLPEVGCTPL